MKRVLHLLNYPGDGGSEKYVYDLITNYGVNNCVFASSLEGPLKEKLQKKGVKCYDLPMKHPFDLKAAILLKEITVKENVSIVHTHFLRENYIAVISKVLGAKIEVLWTFHVNKPMSKINHFLNRFITLKNKKIIAVSEFMKKELIKKGVMSEKIEVIHNGIDLKTRYVFKDQYQREGKVTIATIGRLSEEKGHFFLLDGLKELRKDPDIVDYWNCMIIGNGELLPSLTERVVKYKLEENIVFCGFISNVSEALSDIDIVIIPSKNDAFPYVAIESMAMGKAIIGTDIGGIPELIINNETGLIVQYGDKEELAKAIKELINNKKLANSLGKKARERYLEKFTIEQMFSRITSIYNS